MPALVMLGLGGGSETIPSDWVFSANAAESTVTVTFAVPMVVNAVVRCIDVYSVTPLDAEQDPRERLAVLAVDPGPDATTTVVVLTVERMVDGAPYSLEIADWRVA
jgi:hypothetical protein